MEPPKTAHPIDQVLRAFGVGKLDDRASEVVNEHLEQCAECRARVASISADGFLGRVRAPGRGPIRSRRRANRWSAGR